MSEASTSDDFENFAAGPIDNGENGWAHAGSHDQEVVDVGGNMMFRMSSDPASGDFGGPYLQALSGTAGESTTSATFTNHTISFDFKAVDPTADGSRLEVDFGLDAATDRNNFLVIESIAGQGIRIAVNEPLGDLSGDFNTNDFTAFTGNRTLTSGVDPSAQHTIEMRLEYVDGANNDIIRIFLDGVEIGQTTTFENYRDSIGGTHADNAEANQTSRLFFRGGGSGQPQDGPGGLNEGFYFDNIEQTAFNNANGTGNAENNIIIGNSGNNVLTGAGGNDIIEGGDGDDTAVFFGDWSDYTISLSGGTYTVAGGPDGTDSVSNVEFFEFDNGTFDAADILNDGPDDIDFSGSPVEEGASTGTVVGLLTADDDDLLLGDTLTFSLTDNAGGRFTVVGDELRVADGVKLDFEQAASHTVQVLVTDSHGATFTDSFTIGVTNLTPENIVGNNAANVLVGGTGNDTFSTLGGGGKDFLSGGGGNDHFVYTALTDSTRLAAGRDVIAEFTGGDKIDLSAIDANTGSSGNQAFSFATVASTTFTGAAGQLHWYQVNAAGTVNDKTIIEGDTNGDKIADIAIEITGLRTMIGTDFIL